MRFGVSVQPTNTGYQRFRRERKPPALLRSFQSFTPDSGVVAWAASSYIVARPAVQDIVAGPA